jgi:hypothetical protein
LLQLWSIGQPWNSLFYFSFLILRQSIGLLRRGMNSSQGRYLHRTTQTHNKHAQRHSWIDWDSNPQSQRSSVLRQFMP